MIFQKMSMLLGMGSTWPQGTPPLHSPMPQMDQMWYYVVFLAAEEGPRCTRTPVSEWWENICTITFSTTLLAEICMWTYSLWSAVCVCVDYHFQWAASALMWSMAVGSCFWQVSHPQWGWGPRGPLILGTCCYSLRPMWLVLSFCGRTNWDC